MSALHFPRKSAAGTAAFTRELPQREIRLAWNNVNREQSLEQFLQSGIEWAALTLPPATGDAMADFGQSDRETADEFSGMQEVLASLHKHRRGAKLELTGRCGISAKVLQQLDALGFDDDLWFSAGVELLGARGFSILAHAYPKAVLECPVDFLAPLVISVPRKAEMILDTFCQWGVNQFAIKWNTPHMATLFAQMSHWGFDVGIYNVPDRSELEQAMAMEPAAVTVDFITETADRADRRER